MEGDADPTPLRIRPDREDIYDEIRDEQRRELAGQRAELDSMRTRTSQFLAFVGSASAFLAGTGLTSVEQGSRDAVFFVLAGLATAGFASLAYFGIMVLLGSGGLPRVGEFQFYVDSPKLLKKAETGEKAPSKAAFSRYMARVYEAMVEHNDPQVSRVRRSYIIALASGAATLSLWSVLLWVRG